MEVKCDVKPSYKVGCLPFCVQGFQCHSLLKFFLHPFGAHGKTFPCRTVYVAGLTDKLLATFSAGTSFNFWETGVWSLITWIDLSCGVQAPHPHRTNVPLHLFWSICEGQWLLSFYQLSLRDKTLPNIWDLCYLLRGPGYPKLDKFIGSPLQLSKYHTLECPLWYLTIINTVKLKKKWGGEIR